MLDLVLDLVLVTRRWAAVLTVGGSAGSVRRHGGTEITEGVFL